MEMPTKPSFLFMKETYECFYKTLRLYKERFFLCYFHHERDLILNRSFKELKWNTQ